ncbi:MAG: toll/interleukin-1 receptor domain-containing protein, partial [Candidatus Brocadiales bacterium]|nr:toll/interleukin-1 receptor domain-containing protein [Candidatus Brocadiales bacterium]
MDKAEPIKVFFSYSHEDEDLRDQLAKHLSILEQLGVISSWHDRKIPAGSVWADEIDKKLTSAHIILLLISADFLASEYCTGIEMERALKRHEYGEARVIPIILKPVDWMGAPFAKLQALPKDAKPVTSWADQDEAFANVARGIRKAIESLNEGKDNRFLSFMKKFRGLVGVIVASIALIGVIFNLFAVQDQNEILRSIQSIFISPTFTSTITDTPTFTNTPSNTPTSSITPVTPSPTIKRSDTPTTKPTDTPTPTPITPTDTSTVNPYLSRGLNSGCFDETHWWSNAELNILNGKCLDVTSWFILPEPNQLRIFVNDDKLTQNVNRYLVTEIGKKSIINFIVKLDKLNTLDSTQDAYLAFGVGTPDRSAQRSGGAGEFLVFPKYYESNPYADIYL